MEDKTQANRVRMVKTIKIVGRIDIDVWSHRMKTDINVMDVPKETINKIAKLPNAEKNKNQGTVWVDFQDVTFFQMEAGD